MKINDITIKVHRFGPLENISFKLAPMMIFTGMSSLGKSYANYLVYYFMSAVCNGKLLVSLKEKIGDEVDNAKYVFNLDDFFSELSAQVEGYMRKFLGDDELTCNIEFKSPKRIRTVIINFKKIETNASKNNEHDLIHEPQPFEIEVEGKMRQFVPSLNYAFFYAEHYLQEFILGGLVVREVILPPGRGAFVGENFSVKSEVASSMNMYNLFFRDYDSGINARIRFRRGFDNHFSERLLSLTSGGDLYSVDGKQYIQLNENERIALSAGASSIKDLSPWLFYLKNQWMTPCSFCMEEPEAHQHPSVTVQIADVMAIAMHQPSSNMFHLTTHSDYLIQRLNQLVKLGSIRTKNVGLFKMICKERGLDEQSYLNAGDIKAYYFRRDIKGKTVVEPLDVTEDGIPMKSFFDVVNDLSEREEYINDAIYRMEKGEQ